MVAVAALDSPPFRPEPELPVAAVARGDPEVPTILGHALDVDGAAAGNHLVQAPLVVVADFYGRHQAGLYSRDS
jgi:hypothetical protein